MDHHYTGRNQAVRRMPSLDTLPRGVHLEPTAVLAGGCRQVFGLTSTSASRPTPTSCRFPVRSGPVLLTAFVLDYRCGAVPDSHWVPFSVRRSRTPARHDYRGTCPNCQRFASSSFCSAARIAVEEALALPRPRQAHTWPRAPFSTPSTAAREDIAGTKRNPQVAESATVEQRHETEVHVDLLVTVEER